MKKLSNEIDFLLEKEKRELSNLQKNWMDYFSEKLSKFGAKSPADLSDDKKSDFFNELKKDWEKGVGARKNVSESRRIYEEDIDNEKEFKEYATKILKQAFGDEFDAKKSEKTINGILDKVNGDFGKAIGILKAGLK